MKSDETVGLGSRQEADCRADDENCRSDQLANMKGDCKSSQILTIRRLPFSPSVVQTLLVPFFFTVFAF